MNSSSGPSHRGRLTPANERGAALVEFALALPILLVVVMALVDFGHLIQSRLILTNVSREGGSIASREDPLGAGLGDMLLASGRPLDLSGLDGKIFITRITAGPNVNAPDPTIADQIERGGLVITSGIADALPHLGLTRSLYNHLVFDATNGTADIASVTVVETYYLYRPITPLPGLVPGLLGSDGAGVIIRSRAVF
jgi:TadE-like protein